MKTYTASFGSEMKRPGPTNPPCFDCSEIYSGCTGRPPDPNRKTQCKDFRRLPDVKPGPITGQVFPESRMKGRMEPRLVLRPKPESDRAPRNV